MDNSYWAEAKGRPHPFPAVYNLLSIIYTTNPDINKKKNLQKEVFYRLIPFD